MSRRSRHARRAPAFGIAALPCLPERHPVARGLRFLHQRERFFSALVRPLVWLFIFAAGFRQVLGVSISRPTRPTSSTRSTSRPACVGMILLFTGMQSRCRWSTTARWAAMRVLLVSPMPRWFLLVSQAAGRRPVSLLQVYVFLADRLVLGRRAAAARAISRCCRR